MQNYSKHITIGILGYLAIMIVSSILTTEPGSTMAPNTILDGFLLYFMLGPFMWIPLLSYPIVGLVGLYTVLRYGHIRISPSLISSTLIFYGISLVAAQYGFEMFKRGRHPWQFVVLTGISCTVGYVYANLRTPKEMDNKRP